MLARQLATLVFRETEKTGFSGRSPNDIHERFESLRGHGLLPRGRTKNAQHLKMPEIVAGILSVATTKPGFAGTVAGTLMRLKPVGGVEASYASSETFGKALEIIINAPSEIENLLEVRVSDSEIYTNGHCRAAIEYHSEGLIKVAHYIGENAFSIRQKGAEKNFNPRALISNTIVETIFYRGVFESIYRSLEDERPYLHRPLAVPPEDEEEEVQKQKRAAYFGAQPLIPIFLNIAVDNHVTWPRKETAVEFEGHNLIFNAQKQKRTQHQSI